MIVAAVQKVHLLIAACDGCGKKCGPYTAPTDDALPAGWITKPHWGIHYMTRRDLCKACAEREYYE